MAKARKERRSGLLRWLCCLTHPDFDALDRIRARHGQSHRADAMRYALQEQSRRSRQPEALVRYAALAQQVRTDHLVAAGQTQRWHQLLRAEDFDAMEYIKARHALASGAEAVRFALRAQLGTDQENSRETIHSRK